MTIGLQPPGEQQYYERDTYASQTISVSLVYFICILIGYIYMFLFIVRVVFGVYEGTLRTLKRREKCPSKERVNKLLQCR